MLRLLALVSILQWATANPLDDSNWMKYLPYSDVPSIMESRKASKVTWYQSLKDFYDLIF